MPISNAEYAAILSRLRVNRKESQPLPSGSPVARESDLHDQILAECRRRGWPAFHCRMDMPTTANIGQPDFIIMADRGVTFYVEAKSKTGKLTMAQRAIGAWATTLGHTVHVVRNIEQFIEITKER